MQLVYDRKISILLLRLKNMRPSVLLIFCRFRSISVDFNQFQSISDDFERLKSKFVFNYGRFRRFLDNFCQLSVNYRLSSLFCQSIFIWFCQFFKINRFFIGLSILSIFHLVDFFFNDAFITQISVVHYKLASPWLFFRGFL